MNINKYERNCLTHKKTITITSQGVAGQAPEAPLEGVMEDA
jgi:hypothetical protein